MNEYIPDCTNIGTTFVNSIANMLTCAAIDVKLEIDGVCNQNELLFKKYPVYEKEIEIG